MKWEQGPNFEGGRDPRREILDNIEKTEIDKESMDKTLDSVIRTLEHEKESIRPKDRKGRPGGLVQLKKDVPVILVPDLHGRKEFLTNLLLEKDKQGKSNLDKMLAGELQIVCVGDGMHTEAQGARERWGKALQEYANGFTSSPNMDEEMKRSFGTMKLVMALKESCPEGFYYLKGNHDNILNEEGHGNYPFTKFANEGALVKAYVEKKYGQDFLRKYARFEKDLPIIAVGPNFVISHAEPKSVYPREELINYRDHPEVIEGLTWTDNGEAEKGSVEGNLRKLLNKENIENDYYFGGHRHVAGKYNLRANGHYVQINNPDEMYVAFISPHRKFDPENDIYEVPSLAFKEEEKEVEKEERSIKEKREVKILKGEAIDFVFPGHPVDVYLGPKHLQIISAKNYPRANVPYLLVDPEVFNPDDPWAGGYKGLWENQPLIVGREMTPSRFDFPRAVSRKHLMIRVKDNKFEIIDLNSTNGTKIEL